MALISCPECAKEVSEQATKCPSCGARLKKPKRGFWGSIFKWLFIIFNVLMLIWLIGGLANVGSMMDEPMDEYERMGAEAGAAIGATMVVAIWGFGALILGMFVLFTRPKD